MYSRGVPTSFGGPVGVGAPGFEPRERSFGNGGGEATFTPATANRSPGFTYRPAGASADPRIRTTTPFGSVSSPATTVPTGPKSGASNRPAWRPTWSADRSSRFRNKGDDSPVTEIDRGVETALRARIAAAFPQHGIQGEEFGAQATDAEYVWVIDPIDGTKAFVAGIPVFGTLIALTRKGVPVLGVIDQPMTRERWIGAEGHPTTLNGAPCSAQYIGLT